MAGSARQPSWRTAKGSSSERGYGYAWQKARARFLQAHPLCVMCQDMKPPRVTAAEVVDHIIPHKGDQELFWNESNWQPLCFSHHNGEKQTLEKSGVVRARFDENGRVIW